MAEWLRTLPFSAQNRLSHRCGFELRSGRETNQVLLVGGQVVFLGDLPFSPPPPYD